jgi:Fur family ferric uptake transcriptional regulator
MMVAELLHTVGLRKTRAREAVLQVLSNIDRPLSHQDIANRPETSFLERVTLYRTLTTLRRAGLLHRVRGIDGVWRFRSHRAHSGKCGGNHIHFMCLECNQMFCLPEQPLPWVKEPEGAEIFGKQLVVYGRCAQCKSHGGAGHTDKPENARSPDGE